MKSILLAILLFISAQASASAPLRVISEHLPPHQISQNGKFVGGYSYLIMKEVLKRAGYPTKMEVLPWARAYKTSLEEPNVIVFSMARSKDREERFKWIGSLSDVEFNFYAHEDGHKPNLTSVKEALKYKIVSVRNSISTDILLKFGFVPGENLTLTVGILDAWHMLRKGRADYTYTSTIIADNMYINMGMPSNPFIRQNVYAVKESVYAAASLGTPDETVKRLIDALQSLKRDGTYDDILSQPHPVYE